MPQVFLSIALRLALLSGVAWWAWRSWDAWALVPLCLFAGLMLPNPLLDLLAELWHALRVGVWGPVEGRHFSYRGHSVRVITDAQQRRWVRLSDVRKILGFTASDTRLAITYADGLRMLGSPATAHLCDEALLTHLQTEPGADALKFRHWVERDIAFAARRQRERLGGRAGVKGESLQRQVSSSATAERADPP
jgi:hypothetical protein